MKNTMSEQILLIDDDASLRRVIEFTLEQAGYPLLTASSGEEGLRLFRQHRPTLVITDVQMPGISGYQVLEQVLAEEPSTLVMIITAFSTVEQAVAAMKSGAHDYLTKPFSGDQLRIAVARAFEFHQLQRENSQLKDVLAQHNTAKTMIGESPEMHQLLEQVNKIAPTAATVLINGESGTGKELIAQRLHQLSSRCNQPFIAVNCAAIPKDLLESELFGHVKGAFTGAVKDHRGKFVLADGGTIFLDEIGELPLDLQPKLLRALQEQHIEPVGGRPQIVDVRVVAATNRDLLQAVQEGLFREDLYYRLAVIPLTLAPLRQRRDDIPLLLSHFVAQHPGGRGVTLSAALVEALKGYHWPGNVREVQNAVEQMLILRQGDQLDLDNLPSHIRQPSVPTDKVLILPDEGYSLEALEREAVLQALQHCHGNKTRAAAFLRIPRHTLLYRLEKYSIETLKS